MHSLDKMYLHVAKIITFSGVRPLTNATGFFYFHEGFLYLITARHVVVNEVNGHRPDLLQVSLHSDATDPRQRSELKIPLYVNGERQWLQHPQSDMDVDVAAVAINDPHVLRDYCLESFCERDILNRSASLPLGQDVLIMGFPLGFHDTLHNLPIVRSAIVASSFSHPFKGHPYFLTDARLHRGMSGSPVIVFLNGMSGKGSGWRLLGVHSSTLDVSDRDPAQDEKLALNTTWYASLLTDLLSQS